jgi:hypothetical protein
MTDDPLIGIVVEPLLAQPSGTATVTERETLPIGPALKVIEFVPAPAVIAPFPIVQV